MSFDKDIQALILLVEDDTAARMVTADTLQGAGYMVIKAPDGETAITLLEQHTFAVVISDIRMRKVNGIAVLEAARKQEYRPSVILLTGYGAMETAIAALRKGAFDYLLKPCNPDTLLATVDRAIRQRRDDLSKTEAMHTILQIASKVQHYEIEPDEPPPESPSSSSYQKEVRGRYLRIGDMSIDYYRHEISLDGRPLHITRTEYALLSCLAEAQGRVLTYSEIVRHTHGQQMDDAEALLLLKQHIRNIRSKIPSAYLVNVRSTGYMLIDPNETTNSQR